MFVLGVTLLAILCQSVSSYDSNFDLATANRYVYFSGAAYCADPIFVKNSIDDWSCNACKQFPNVEAQVFHGSKKDANGFVGYDSDANEVIISFAGTDPLSIANWIDDLDFIKTDYPYCDGCQVHEGFYKSFNSVKDDVKVLLDSYLAQHSNASIAITGHSLGAALAVHAAAEFTHAGYSQIKTIYNYGLPRVGETNFEQWYVNSVIGTFRMVHLKDPVPHLPPMNWGFHHMPYEVFYKLDYNDWKLCDVEGEDESCSDQYVVDADVVNHLNYLDMDFTTNYLSCEL